MLPHLLAAKEQNINEADTVVRIIKVLEDVLGYDPMSEISREAQLRDKYVDLMIKIGGVPKLIIEAKAAGVELRDRHIEQAENYASKNNYPWVLLTNGVVWRLYHLTFEEGIEYDVAFNVDLSKDDFNHCADTLAVLHRSSIASNKLAAFWACRVALSPDSISKALLHEDVLNELRRQIKKDTGTNMEIDELAEALHDMFSQEVREQVGAMRIRKNRKPPAKPQGEKAVPVEAEMPPVGEVSEMPGAPCIKPVVDEETAEKDEKKQQ
ncbi:MAG TPA: type I restriction enzyme HsdR N-terminal domain-containing protein [Methanomassiliicoccales archaeon]|jgi:hypothetical protein